MENTLKTFLKKNILQILLAIVPPLLMWHIYQKESSSLEIEVLNKTPIVSVDNKYASEVKIFHGKKIIENLSIIEMRVTNSGSKPISKDDFDIPLEFSFNGDVLGEVEVFKVNPTSLPVKFTTMQKKVRLEPLLLNNEDSFKVRIKVSSDHNEALIDVSARIKGIHEIGLIPFENNQSPLDKYFLIIMLIVAVVSGTSSVELLRKYRIVSISVSGVTFELAHKILSEQLLEPRTKALGEKLDIKGHDHKSNTLLLRLKIENQLRTLYKHYNKGKRSFAGSITHMSRDLVKDDVIDSETYQIIRDISPVMNRELHEPECYLSDEEFKKIEDVSLTVIVLLDKKLEEIKIKE